MIYPLGDYLRFKKRFLYISSAISRRGETIPRKENPKYKPRVPPTVPTNVGRSNNTSELNSVWSAVV